MPLRRPINVANVTTLSNGFPSAKAANASCSAHAEYSSAANPPGAISRAASLAPSQRQILQDSMTAPAIFRASGDLWRTVDRKSRA